MDYPHNFGARQRFQFQVPCVQSSCEIRSLKESRWRADDLGGRIEPLHHPSRKSKGICYRSGTCQLINIKYHEMINIFEATIQWPGAIAFHLGVPVGMITTYIGSVYACKSTEIDNNTFTILYQARAFPYCMCEDVWSTRPLDFVDTRYTKIYKGMKSKLQGATLAAVYQHQQRQRRLELGGFEVLVRPVKR